MALQEKVVAQVLNFCYTWEGLEGACNRVGCLLGWIFSQNFSSQISIRFCRSGYLVSHSRVSAASLAPPAPGYVTILVATIRRATTTSALKCTRRATCQSHVCPTPQRLVSHSAKPHPMKAYCLESQDSHDELQSQGVPAMLFLQNASGEPSMGKHPVSFWAKIPALLANFTFDGGRHLWLFQTLKAH